MKWELERHKWSDLGDHAVKLPVWIAEFVASDDPQRVNSLMCMIESAVVPVNGPLRAGAAEVAACLVQGLLCATEVSKVDILYLLFQFAGGVVDVPESDLIRNVRREVKLGFPLYCEIAETGTRGERFQCIDLLSFCARFGDPYLNRAVATMRRIAAIGNGEAAAVAIEFEDLARDGYLID